MEPQDRVGWHNLAAAQGDRGNAAESEAAARRAIALGIPAPETRLVLARALQAQNRFDEAERAFVEALELRPDYAHAHRDLAQLRWMRSGSRAAALRSLDDALKRSPEAVGLHLVRSIVLEFTGDAAAALASAEAGLRHATKDLQLLRQAAHLCAETGAPDRALGFARAATQLAPDDPAVLVVLCEALLASGLAREAGEAAGRLLAAQPLDQHALALCSTAWRLLADPRHEALNDPALVHAEVIPVPPGWSDLGTFLEDLGTDLDSLHQYRTHPFQQSVRGGGQAPLHAREMQLATVRALFAVIDDVGTRHLERVGKGSDPFRARNSGRMAITGAWSVRLASGGHHTDHVHQRGWISSAFYVRIPPDLARAGPNAGCLRFGKPGIVTQPVLAAERHIRPEPGLLALFPSYQWHGVEPFESAHARLTVAFDAVPG